MRAISLNNTFQLHMAAQDPSILYLHYKTGYRNESHQMDIIEFLETLPVLFSNFSFNHLSGALHPFHGCFGFVSNEKKQPERFLSLLRYQYYDTLKSDLQKINPTYHFHKKANETLQDVTYYVKEATKTMTVQEVASQLAPMNDVLSTDDFYQFFHPIHKEEGTYLLPWSNLEKVGSIHSCIKDKIHSFPAYSLKNSRHEILLYVLNDNFFLIKHGEKYVESLTFPLHEKQKVAEEIELFFPFNPKAKYQYANDIIVESFSNGVWQKRMETTACYTGFLSSVSDDLSELRPFFQKEYGVKARSRQDLWDKGMKELKKETFSLDYPFFAAMSHGTPEEEKTTRNKKIIDKFDDLKTKIQLNSLERSGLFDQSNEEKTELYSIVGRNVHLYMMPDYGELASNAPSFSDIMKKKEVKP